jgi:hypothetical protein
MVFLCNAAASFKIARLLWLVALVANNAQQ